MSRSYYYLVAFLPSIEFGAKPSFFSEKFENRCREQLTSADFMLIEQVIHLEDYQLESDNPLINFWKKFNHDLRNEIAWVRALEANKNPRDHLRGEKNEDRAVVDVIAKAAEAPDPLSAEQMIDRARWKYLDELILFHYFDLEVLIAYALKLKILERYHVIESPRGKELFKEYTKVEINLN